VEIDLYFLRYFFPFFLVFLFSVVNLWWIILCGALNLNGLSINFCWEILWPMLGFFCWGWMGCIWYAFLYQQKSGNWRIWFLAYFLEYAIVRTSSVCLSVCRPHYYFSWGRPIGAIYGSIDSLWPKDKEFFLDRPWTRWEGSEVQIPYIFIYKYCILLVFKKGY
jgi:hypothetical protein